MVFELARDANTELARGGLQNVEAVLKLMLELTGVLGVDLTADRSLDAAVEQLIAKRQEARRVKDFKAADEIRLELNELGIVLEDTPQGVRWKRK